MGFGGGIINITSDNLLIDGFLDVSGKDAFSDQIINFAGGGGGTIYLKCKNIIF